MQAGDVNLEENRKPVEEKQARLAKIDGLELKGDFEQRRSGWNKSESKAACFERGHTDHFKAECPIWEKRKKSGNRKETGKGEKGKGKGKKRSIMFACLEEEEMGPREEEIPGNEANVAYRQINLPNVLGAMAGKERIGRKNVLALSTQDLMVEVYVVSRG